MTSNGGSAGSPPAKKRHLMADLSDFRFDRVLSDFPEDKRIAVCGKLVGRGDDEADAVVVVEKLPYTADRIKDFLNGEMKLKEQFQNDVYAMHHAHQTDEAANQVMVL